MKKTYCDICGEDMKPEIQPVESLAARQMMRQANDVCPSCLRTIKAMNWDGVIRKKILEWRDPSEGTVVVEADHGQD